MRVKGNKLLEPAPREERPCSISRVKGDRASEQEGGRNLHLTRTKFSALSQFAVGLDSDQGHRFPFRFHDLRTRLETLRLITLVSFY